MRRYPTEKQTDDYIVIYEHDRPNALYRILSSDPVGGIVAADMTNVKVFSPAYLAMHEYKIINKE